MQNLTSLSQSSSGNITLKTGKTLSLGGASLPSTSDGAALGSATKMWSDLFLASGGVINFNNGDVTITHASGSLAISGGSIIFGTSAAPETIDTAGTKFISIYTDCGATSDDSRGMYLRHYITGAGGGGEAGRIFTTVSNVAGATAHGAHISLSFGASGTVTGLGVAVRGTLQIPNTGTQAGTLAALQAEIWSDGSTSDSAGCQLSSIRFVNGGDSTGMADVDDDCAALDFSGFTVADGNMIATKAAGTCPNVTKSIRIRIAGTAYYLYAGDAPLTA